MPIYSKPAETPEWGSGQTPINGWTISTAYSLGVLVTNGGGVFLCTTAGTSASSGDGPAGTGTGITDGSAVWSYSHPAYSAGPVAEPSAYQKGRGFMRGKELPTGVMNWLFYTLWQWVLYLGSFTSQTLSWGAKQTFSQTVAAANALPTAWQSSTAYAVDELVQNDTAKVYICIQAGTSAASGGPTGTGASITDGTAKWLYLRGSGPALTGTTTVTGQAGVRGVGTTNGAAPGLSTNNVLLLEPVATDPGSPAEGSIWYNSTSHTWKGQKNGSVVTFTTS